MIVTTETAGWKWDESFSIWASCAASKSRHQTGVMGGNHSSAAISEEIRAGLRSGANGHSTTDGRPRAGDEADAIIR